MTRTEAATELCRRLAQDVAEITPAGIGHWDRSWQIVASADASFLTELTAWEATGAEAERVRVRTAYAEVKAAWQRAVSEFDAQRQAAR